MRVHALKDGAHIGTLRPDINGFQGSGGDSDTALNVTLRSSGEYVMFLEREKRGQDSFKRVLTPFGSSVSTSFALEDGNVTLVVVRSRMVAYS